LTHLICPRASRLWSSSSGGHTSPRAAAASRPPLAASDPSGTTTASRCRPRCWWSMTTPPPSTVAGENSMTIEDLPGLLARELLIAPLSEYRKPIRSWSRMSYWLKSEGVYRGRVREKAKLWCASFTHIYTHVMTRILA
jgi:hypothetical protein